MCEATDSDLSIRNLGTSRRNTSDIISESSQSTSHDNNNKSYLIVNYDTRRSQSDKSLYDNVSVEYNLIVDQCGKNDVPSSPHRHIVEVTRSKSFNDPTYSQKYLSPPTLHAQFSNRNQEKFTKSRESIPSSDRSSLSGHNNERFISVPVVDLNSCINPKTKKPDRCKKGSTINRRNSRSSGHVLGRIFRRMQKFSFGWRKHSSKNIPRGDHFFKLFY